MGTRLDSIDWEAVALRCRGKVELMAATLLVSRKTIERYFRKKWHMTPARWAKRKLLERAMALIRQGYSIKAVVIDLNVCSETWLCREFRKMYGASPGSFHPAGSLSQAEHFVAKGTSFPLAGILESR
jgi:methylphosphotriester-DNA--protein-cysteine methyltransferase